MRRWGGGRARGAQAVGAEAALRPRKLQARDMDGASAKREVRACVMLDGERVPCAAGGVRTCTGYVSMDIAQRGWL